MQAQERLKGSEVYAVAAASSASGYFETSTTTLSPRGRAKTVQDQKPSIEAVCADVAELPLLSAPFAWRVFEVIAAAIAFVALLPVMLMVGLVVWIDSPGPILFRQKRVGRGGRLFTFIKFRTFYVDARERFPHLYAYSYDDQDIEKLCFKVPHDPRATRAGAWLRTTTLDELPNFWNVLTGDMALVGPRPEIPEMLPYYRREELAKFTVRPGVTGLAQVSGRGWLSFRDTNALDVEYVETHHWTQDFKILFLTIQRIVLRHGAF
jgi:lipopolysaccharide/colanic/teichoic acid biosynthesis glycosyltransferase